MELSKKPNFSIALRSLAFVVASATVAACGSSGASGTSTIPAPGPTSTATQPQSIVAWSGNNITLTGSVVALRTGSFQIEGGKGVGYLWIYETSTTKYTGAKPYVGENVEVVGTGSPSTSVTATSVSQVGTATPAPTSSNTTVGIISWSGSNITLAGDVVAVRTGSFQIQGGKGVGYLWIYETSTTKYSGSKPYVGEDVEVSGTGSPSTSVTATSVTQLNAGTATPSPTATAPSATTTTVSTGNVARYQGCPVFTAGDYYNAPVTTRSVDPNSAKYINAAVNAGNTGGFYASTGYEKVNLANNSTPLLTVHPKVSWHSFAVPYPWSSGYYIEKLGDAHAMVVQTQSCHLYEAYSTTYSSGILSAYSGANWDLTKAFVPLAPGTPSSMASGLSIFAGMVKWEDYLSGSINHALNWAPPAHTVAQWKFVRPASDTDGLAFNGTSAYQLPYGAHLRLKSSFSTAGWGPEAAMVAKAMKTYGVYLSDTGSSGNAIYFANAANGTNPWSGSDLSALSKLRLSDFDVLTLPSIQAVPGH